MAKRPDLSDYQKKIVHRYYEHRGTINAAKLGDLVGELYLADSPAKADKLWKQAEQALLRAGANPVRVQKLVADRDVAALARLVNELG
jgi:hypothetical protein